MNVKNETGREMVQVASPEIIDRISGKLVSLILQTVAIKAAYNKQEQPTENSLSVQSTMDSSEASLSMVEAQDPLDQSTTSTDSDENLIEKKETPISLVEEDQSQDLVDSIPSDEEKPFTDPELALLEMAKQINELIEQFLQEAQGILLQSTQDSVQSIREDSMRKEQAIQRFRSLVSEFQDAVREIPGVNDKFFDLYSLILKSPEMLQEANTKKNIVKRKKKSPPPPTDSDSPSGRKTILGKVKGWVSKIFSREKAGKEKEQEMVRKVHA